MLATVEDIQTRLARSFEDEEVARVEALIKDVSSLITAYARKDFLPTIPDEIVAVTCAEVIRYMNSNPGILSEEIGEISTRYAVFRFGLSADARTVLRAYRNRITSVHAGGGRFGGI